MGSRLIRDDMLDSARVQTLPAEARWLFVAVLLSADDVGLFELGNHFKLARKAGLDMKMVEKLLPMLVDADLVRAYQVGDRTFGYIPRFRQRLQIKRSKCPLPPLSLIADDEHAVNQIKHLMPIPTVDHGEAPKSTAIQPSEPEPEPEPLSVKSILPTTTVVAAPRAKARRAEAVSTLKGTEDRNAIQGRALMALDAVWELPEDWGEDAERLGWDPPTIVRESEKFRQYWVSGKGAGTRRSIKGWRQTWSNWLENASKRR